MLQVCGYDIDDIPIARIRDDLIPQACGFMETFRYDRVVSRCPFCGEDKPFHHHRVCGQNGANSPRQLFSRCLTCKSTLPLSEESYVRCALCGARYCNRRCFQLGEHMRWCPYVEPEYFETAPPAEQSSIIQYVLFDSDHEGSD